MCLLQKAVSFILVLATSNLVFAKLPDNSPDFCSWEEKVSFTSEAEPAVCETKCLRLCQDNVAEYHCYGIRAHTDTSEERLDMNDPTMYSYCTCMRSKVTRNPGNICGPENCNDKPWAQAYLGDQITDPDVLTGMGTYVEGLNNMIEGRQGQRTLDINANYAEEDADMPCDEAITYKHSLWGIDI